jgi:hypothetical protein
MLNFAPLLLFWEKGLGDEGISNLKKSSQRLSSSQFA